MPRSQQADPRCALTPYCIAPESRGKRSVRVDAVEKDFRSRSEEESFTNGFPSRILIQVSRMSDSLIAHGGGSAAH